MKIRESIVIQFKNGLRGLLTFCIDGKIHDFGIDHRALLSIYIYINIYIGSITPYGVYMYVYMVNMLCMVNMVYIVTQPQRSLGVMK